MLKQLIFFLEIEKVKNPKKTFQKLLELDIWYTYFYLDTTYYLFAFAEKNPDVNSFFESITLINLLHTRRRKIRSLRGFFLYVLEFIQNGECKILETSLEPLFWVQIKSILRQNRKYVLENFLFSDSRRLIQH